MKDMDEYLSGRRLYGDDLSPEQIREWYEDEKEGYANLGAKDVDGYEYVYHGLNWFHAFRHVKPSASMKVLGYGSAYGDELLPIMGHVAQLTIVDPADAFHSNMVHGVPCNYIKPAVSGDLPLESAQFDLIVCFGVLHHVPNVRAVVGELSRVLGPDGLLLLREPIVSMGDWRKRRAGLTKHERGIPLAIMRDILEESRLSIGREGLCVFPLVQRVVRHLKPDVYNSRLVAVADAVMSWMFRWNVNYHPKNWFQKFRPTSAFYVLKKST